MFNKSFKTLLLTAGSICCSIGAASSSLAGWCDRGLPSRDGEWRLEARVFTYVDDSQVFRSELRPKFSYGVEFYCVRMLRPRTASGGMRRERTGGS